MKECPVCHDALKEIPKYGVLIDACPSCRGVWLDRGELEKVLSLARDFGSSDDNYEHKSNDNYEHKSYEREKHRPEEYDKHSYPRKKKKQGIFDLFEDLFD